MKPFVATSSQTEKTWVLKTVYIGEKLHGIGFGHDFLHVTPKVQGTKVKIDKLDCVKI